MYQNNLHNVDGSTINPLYYFLNDQINPYIGQLLARIGVHVYI